MQLHLPNEMFLVFKLFLFTDLMTKTTTLHVMLCFIFTVPEVSSFSRSVVGNLLQVIGIISFCFPALQNLMPSILPVMCYY